jgi:hypothetical protein
MGALVWGQGHQSYLIFIRVWHLFVRKDCSSKSFLLKYIEDVEKAGR